MNSAAKSIAEEVENLQAFGSKARVSYHTFERGIFRYGLAVLSVALALGIKLLLQQLHFGYPLSTSFLAAIAVTFWYGGTGPGILALVLSCAAFGFFVLPYQVDYRIVLADGSTKPVYASRTGLSHLFYFFYFALVALVMSWFSSSRRRAERLLSQARDKLEIKVAERTARLRKLNDELLGQVAERALAEDHLRQTEQRLRDLIANAPVILFALDRSGMLTLSEGKGLDTFGVKPGELVGQSIFDLYHDSPDLHSNARRALAGESVTFVTEAKNQFFETHLIPVFDKSEKVAGVTGVTYNITDRRKTERELRLVIDTIPAMSWSTLADGPNEYCSKGWMEYTGMKQGEELGYGWLEAFHPEDREAHFAKWRAATETGGLFESVARIRGADGVYRWFLTQGVPLRDESGNIVRWYGTNVDIDERKRAESLLQGEKQLLEMIATGVPLKQILDAVCGIIEEQRPGTLASVLLMNPDGVHLNVIAGPKLPNEWTRQMEKMPIGPCAGSCGTAAYRGSPVIVSDIATDPLWDVPEHRASALKHGLRASWSNPVLSSHGKVLGTFCLYYREPRAPDSQDLELIELATHLVRVAIERDRAEHALRTSEQLARSHVDVMMRSLDVLATEAAPEKFVGEMLRTIGQHLCATRVLLWLRNQSDDSLRLHLMIENDRPVAPDPEHPFVKYPHAWKENALVQEMLFTKSPAVCDDVEHDSRISSELRKYLTSRGSKRFMTVPMFVSGEVRGFIGVQHAKHGAYQADEIELAQALAHHVMLATHSQELVEQQREAAILKERTRMARDIHDTLAQGFTGVIVQMEAAEDALLDDDQDHAVGHVRRARELARNSLGEARRSVHALRPQALEKAAFADALKAIIKNTAAGTPLRTEFRVHGEPRQLAPSVEENLLHIGQEALTNALKHAHATKFHARLSFNADGVYLELRDNGAGFVVDAMNGGGIGLIGMKERADQIGATLELTSEPGKGTKITAVSPYPTA
ncbi:MAG TPA: GAF domain-containing protein [Candidatus Udaeobacter sp.]|nr:GAF domain-containing protein [Candidatus Udaeobacter sp.]